MIWELHRWVPAEVVVGILVTMAVMVVAAALGVEEVAAAAMVAVVVAEMMIHPIQIRMELAVEVISLYICQHYLQIRFQGVDG